MSPTTAILVAACLLIAAAVRAMLGFGDAVLAMPLLTWVVGVRSATGLVGLTAVTLTVVLAVRLRRFVVAADLTHLV